MTLRNVTLRRATFRRPICVRVLTLSLIALWGCSPVRSTDEPTLANRRGLERLVFGDYWKEEGLPDRALTQNGMAIASFTVEFVVERILEVEDRYGVSKREIAYSQELYRDVPNRLYELFVKRLSGNEFRIVEREAVTGSAAFARYERRTLPEDGLIRHDKALASEQGGIKKTSRVTARGLQLLGESSEARLEIDRALIEELGISSVVHVVFRVGVIDGSASIEKGSIAEVVTGSEVGRLTSLRSLKSSTAVTQDGGSIPTVTGRFHVEDSLYLKAMDELFPTYAGLLAEVVR